MDDLVAVEFLVPYHARTASGFGPRYNAGEIAGLPREEADVLILSGGARPLSPPTQPAPRSEEIPAAEEARKAPDGPDVDKMVRDAETIKKKPRRPW